MPYNHTELEKKWQQYWSDHKTYKTETPFVKDNKGDLISDMSSGGTKDLPKNGADSSQARNDKQYNRPKKYILDMFPYPSGAGLHVGHPKGYTATDIVSRYYHANGHNVLHTMGWDAFGLPAENHAIKTGTHPAITTAENIATFKFQLQSLGLGYDWDREINTTDPKYYQWTQWIFLKLFERGLAYEQDLPINYCPHDKTGLANEEVINGCCERCGTRVERRAIRQWVLRITDYADRLIDDLDELDWTESIKDMQRNWIGRSEGCEFEMKKSDDPTKSIRVYTTRIDTVYGMTYAVMAPDHPHVADFISPDQRQACEEYIEASQGKSDQDRTNESREKTGVFTGSYVINPYNGESVPLWIADYVLGHYGTGAVMAVPAHDERDFEFAKKYGLSVKPILHKYIELWDEETQAKGLRLGSEMTRNTYENLNVKDLTQESKSEFLDGLRTQARKDIQNKVITFDGYLFDSDQQDGLFSSEARKALTEKAEKEGFGQKKVNYKLRDWLFSRQRYWGEPIPLIHLSHEDVNSLPRIRSLDEAVDPSIAYVLKSEATPTDHSSTLCSKGEVRELVIGGKIVSKIYEGITGKIIIDWDLPLTLPAVEKYEPAGDGHSPLATVEDWVNVDLASNLSGKRETNTMPQWGGSCWYYLRFMDPHNGEALAGQEALDYWQNVDEYVGGAEHAVLHLLYARFWHKVLYDIGVVPTKEPFQKLTNLGMILAYAYERQSGSLVAVDLVEERDGKFFEKSTGEEVKQVVAKMSKSLKNVVNPNDIIAQYGADTLRLYEMSMGAFTDTAPWNPDAIIGVRRFLDKVYTTFIEGKNQAKDDMKAMKLLNKTIKKVGEDIREYKFNTALAALQILINEGCPVDREFAAEWQQKFAIILHPFAPHIAEELWSHMGHDTSIYHAAWPEYDEFMLVDDEVTIAVQINGKLRGTFTFLNGVAQEEVSEVVMADESIKKWIGESEVIKEIFIPNKMLSIVVRDKS